MKRIVSVLFVLTFLLLIYLFTESAYFTGQNTWSIIRNVTGLSAEQAEVLNLVIRKTTHFCLFGSLAVLLYVTFRNFKEIKNPIFLAWLFASFAGALDELHQSTQPGRVASFLDVVIDASGAAFFLFLLLVFKKVRGKLR